MVQPNSLTIVQQLENRAGEIALSMQGQACPGATQACGPRSAPDGSTRRGQYFWVGGEH